MIYQKLTMANGSRLHYPLTKDWRKPLANSGVLKPNLLHLEAVDYHIETDFGIVKYCHRCTTDSYNRLWHTKASSDIGVYLYNSATHY